MIRKQANRECLHLEVCNMPKSGELTRAKLLEAASVLVAEASLANLSIENIADRAGGLAVLDVTTPASPALLGG